MGAALPAYDIFASDERMPLSDTGETCGEPASIEDRLVQPVAATSAMHITSSAILLKFIPRHRMVKYKSQALTAILLAVNNYEFVLWWLAMISMGTGSN
jgi:hypothetical protein